MKQQPTPPSTPPRPWSEEDMLAFEAGTGRTVPGRGTDTPAKTGLNRAPETPSAELRRLAHTTPAARAARKGRKPAARRRGRKARVDRGGLSVLGLVIAAVVGVITYGGLSSLGQPDVLVVALTVVLSVLAYAVVVA